MVDHAGGEVRQTHRNEIVTLLSQFLETHAASPPSTPLDTSQPVYLSAAAAAGEGKPTSLTLHYSVRLRSEI
ncbi:hypothetical protein T484DRAFT_1818922 [Baffinella frigidus]|nr:hypothetical protein T484DRAFT_1818922 [Cryptophyta sp. CCMP2293]